ncbi:hypothetical protein BDP27DRAFT_1379294 [Rhodocollybia butyracea]|uniref:Integrase core domain-containing protein n=1 Tax=Rhodocollybia butyracea TaxID=206335 RepID=A0A9P5QBS3_9AGAR|nr:hypothetical protein BDP27DRAFT_1379294 [Rhodocollybia butyracea]
MNEVRGRGSYISGRSVHNIRIERLWVDLTSGFGKKWKLFFRLLEVHHGLNVENEIHIWLLHFLFLPRINADVDIWVSTWNHHGMMEQGFRGVFASVASATEEENDNEEHHAEYGIDWDELDRANIRNHHHEHNQADIGRESTNVFDIGTPEDLSHVEVPLTSCPLTAEGVQMLTSHLEQLAFYSLHDEISLVNLWNAASNYLRSQSTLDS